MVRTWPAVLWHSVVMPWVSSRPNPSVNRVHSTLRTFHVGGVAGSASVESSLHAKFDGTLQFDGLRTVTTESNDGKKIQVVIGRTGEIRNMDLKADRLLNTMHIPYGAILNVKDGQKVAKGDVICMGSVQ